jgi:hypothetical protein
VTAVRLDDRLADEEPESHTLGLSHQPAIQPSEAFEKAILLTPRYTNALIADADNHFLPCLTPFDENPTAPWRILDRVLH